MIVVHSPWASLRHTWPIRKSEWMCAVGICALWLLFALRPDLLDSAPGYTPLKALAPHWVWQWLCFIAGFGRLAALFINGGYHRTPLARAITAFLSCLIWFSLLRGLAENVGIGMILAAIPLFTDVANTKQSAQEAATAEGLRYVERRSIPRH